MSAFLKYALCSSSIWRAQKIIDSRSSEYYCLALQITLHSDELKIAYSSYISHPDSLLKEGEDARGRKYWKWNLKGTCPSIYGRGSDNILPLRSRNVSKAQFLLIKITRGSIAASSHKISRPKCTEYENVKPPDQMLITWYSSKALQECKM